MLGKNFFLKLAWNNVRRNRSVYLPYVVAVAIISGVFFLVNAIIESKSISNMPSGQTAQLILKFAVVVFGIFAFSFMLYINGFLIKRRKREFGLYSVLGLEKGHVCRVLLIENLLTLGGGVGVGFLFAGVFGRLIFMLLLYFIHSSPGSVFELPANAFIVTGALFGAVFLVTSLYNTAQIRLANPVALLQSEKKGEKDSKLLWPAAIFGAGGMALSYWAALSIPDPSFALLLFFPIAALVILATQALFRSGSIVFLKFLKGRKKLYYKPNNFISISGMFQRMKQNASGLATICILGTMLVVTVCLSTSLYLNQEASLKAEYPFGVNVYMREVTDDAVFTAFDAEIGNLAQAHNVALSYDAGKLVAAKDATKATLDRIVVNDGSKILNLKNSLVLDGVLMFDVKGQENDCIAFTADVRGYYQTMPLDSYYMSDIYSARQGYYGIFGGLIFAGAFFAILFLAVTVLIIYFKQITEGYEDRERFVILQKVGMDDRQVKSTINRQILWVFFIPLVGALVNAAFSTGLIVKILQVFRLYDSDLTVWCMVITCALFSLTYLVAYRVTAKTYYKIIKW
jgi:ABC-type antimicrobial peptide transport system permease subunit